MSLYDPRNVFWGLPGETLSATEGRMREEFRIHQVREDLIIKEMLGRWVSELEPVVMRDKQMQIIGLGQDGVPLGSHADVIVRPAQHLDSRQAA